MYDRRPYRLTLSAFVAVLATALGVGACPAQAAMIVVDVVPAQTSIDVGQQVDVTITANISENILGFGFDLLYNDQLLSVASVEIAPPFVPLNAPDGDGLAGLAYPNNVVGSNVKLATVTLTALAPGKSGISIGVTPGDPMEGFPQYQGWADLQVATDASITISAAGSFSSSSGGGAGPTITDVPEPATIALIVLGAVMARKFSRKVTAADKEVSSSLDHLC